MTKVGGIVGAAVAVFGFAYFASHMGNFGWTNADSFGTIVSRMFSTAGVDGVPFILFTAGLALVGFVIGNAVTGRDK